MTKSAAPVHNAFDLQIAAEREMRSVLIESVIKRLTDDLRSSMEREYNLMARREQFAPASVFKALSPSQASAAEPAKPNGGAPERVAAAVRASIGGSPFALTTLVPMKDEKGRDPRGAFKIIREILQEAGDQGLFQADLDKRAKEFGFTAGAIARGKQRLRVAGVASYDANWKTWRWEG